MVFFYQSLEPVPVNSTAVFPGDQVGNLLDILVESVLLLFRKQEPHVVCSLVSPDSNGSG